jgi:hypothetical protein
MGIAALDPRFLSAGLARSHGDAAAHSRHDQRSVAPTSLVVHGTQIAHGHRLTRPIPVFAQTFAPEPHRKQVRRWRSANAAISADRSVIRERVASTLRNDATLLVSVVPSRCVTMTGVVRPLVRWVRWALLVIEDERLHHMPDVHHRGSATQQHARTRTLKWVAATLRSNFGHR